jgi:hypothetical protein
MYSGLRESDPAVTRALVVERSTTVLISNGLDGNWVDRITAQAPGRTGWTKTITLPR